jgi:FkbM family methyltransferase
MQRLRVWGAGLTGRAVLRLPGETIRPVFNVEGKLERRKICALDAEEAPLTRFLGELRPGDVVYDVGANLGLYAIPSAMKLASHGRAATSRPTGRVIAFEPVPAWAARLRQNAQANRLTNLDVFDVALSDTNGRADFLLKPIAGSGMGSLMAGYDVHIPAGNRHHIEVEVSRAEQVIARNNLPAPTVLKIDVEGAEYKVLDGFGEFIAQPACRFVLIEVHRGLSDEDAIDKLLTARGFEVVRGEPRGAEYHLFASRPARDDIAKSPASTPR